MDRQKRADKVEANGEGSARRGGAEQNEGFAGDSWFRDRLDFVRSELRKELRWKLVGAPTKQK